MISLGYIGGLGAMASPAARHFGPESGVKVDRVHDRGAPGGARDEARAAWRAHGATLVSSLSEVCRQDNLDGLVICAGKNGDDVSLVADAARELGKSNPRCTILHLSTVSLRFVESAREFAATHGVAYVNYPLTGGPKGASLGGSHPNGMLILCSGDQQIYEKFEPVLKLLGRPKFFGPQPSSAALVKLIGHFMVFNGLMGIGSAAALFAEGFRDGNLEGKETAEFFEFLNGGAGGTRQWDVALSKGVKDAVWDQGFFLHHAAVDAVYAAEAAHAAGLSQLCIESVLNVALGFSYVLHQYSEQSYATHAVVREFLSAKSPALDRFVREHRKTVDFPGIIEDVIDSFPAAVKRSALLEITREDF